MLSSCPCRAHHRPRRIVVTGGPGAGKTAVLELVRQSLCPHVVVLPEAAGIVFGGGFPRTLALAARKAAQRAIFFVQRELEATIDPGDDVAIVLCDRGTVDGIAYWPGPEDFWASLGTTPREQFDRYHAVIHLRTPDATEGYNRDNPLRTEVPAEAAAIDERIAAAWSGHPRRFEVPVATEFMTKAEEAIAVLRGELPECCRPHVVPLSPVRRAHPGG